MTNILNLNIRGIQHVGIPVTDILRSEHFYTKLGFKNIMKGGFISEGEKGTAVMMESNGIIIELYQMPDSQMKEIRNRKDGRIDHIALDVRDIDSTFRELKSGGFEIEDDAPVFIDFWEKGCRYFTMIGPDGERIEFNQIL